MTYQINILNHIFLTFLHVQVFVSIAKPFLQVFPLHGNSIPPEIHVQVDVSSI